MSGPTWILATGAILLAIGIFVARPYCRFLCPYGVLLGWASFLSRRKVTVTPDECVQCRLCEDVCPFDAIRKPTAPRSEPRLTGLRRLALILVLLPVMTVVGAWAGHRLSGPLSHLDKRVQLIDQLDRESETGFDAGFQVEAFRGSGKPEAELREEVNEVRDRFALGSILLGTFLGLTVGGRLTALCLRGERKDYEPDRSACLACGRCFEVCPREHQRRKNRGRAGKDA